MLHFNFVLLQTHEILRTNEHLAVTICFVYVYFMSMVQYQRLPYRWIRYTKHTLTSLVLRNITIIRMSISISCPQTQLPWLWAT